MRNLSSISPKTRKIRFDGKLKHTATIDLRPVINQFLRLSSSLHSWIPGMPSLEQSGNSTNTSSGRGEARRVKQLTMMQRL